MAFDITERNAFMKRNQDIDYIAKKVSEEAMTDAIAKTDPIITAKAKQILDKACDRANGKNKFTEEQLTQIMNSNRSFVSFIIQAKVCKKVVLKACNSFSDHEISLLSGSLNLSLELKKHNVSSKLKYETIASFIPSLFESMNQFMATQSLIQKFNKQLEVIVPDDIQLEEEDLENLIGSVAESIF